MEGELMEGPKPWEILQKKPHDAAIAFGQGPVIDQGTKRRAEDMAKLHGISVTEEINSWGRTTAVAMGYLYDKGEYREAFFSGGKTGGGDFASEAKLMNDGATKVFGKKIPDENLHLEEKSTNTLANFENTLNIMDDSKGIGKRDFKKLFLRHGYRRQGREGELGICRPRLLQKPTLPRNLQLLSGTGKSIQGKAHPRRTSEN